jgi:AcrR family transcriptional regulator
MASDTELRHRLLAAAREQLASSPTNDVATRAVCESAGVSQPVLYRIFGDKQGLLDALVEDGFARYVERKSALRETVDPIADLHAGWDDHMDFALTNPAVYRLMFAPRPGATSPARQQIFDILVRVLVRCAAAGRLVIGPEAAARTILSANVGVALNMINQPALYDDPELPGRMRDVVFGALIGGPTSAPVVDPVAGTAARLRAQLALTGTGALASEELALLLRWLDRLTTPTCVEPDVVVINRAC